MNVKYPNITVELVGQDGNVFNIIGKVTKALRKGGVPSDEVSAFQAACMASGSYDDVLCLVMNTVNVD